MCGLQRRGGERGGALVLALLVLLLFTLLGAAAMQMGATEIEQSGVQAAQLEAGYLAESGVDLAIGWFARPETFPGWLVLPAGPCAPVDRAGLLLARRCRRGNGRASFLTDGGESQLQGTRSMPDGAATVGAAALFPPSAGPAGGSTIDVILFGPMTAGAVCTVQSTGRTAGGATRTIRVELYEAAEPVLTAAAGAGAPGPAVGPVRLHWGGLRYDHDGRLPADPSELPIMTPIAPVDGRPYAVPDPLEERVDRWMQAVIGGLLLEPAGDTAAAGALLEQWAASGSVRIGAAAASDVEDWPYAELKRWSRRFGRYYTTDRDGRLYRDGLPPALEADAVLGVVDKPAPMVFLDTLDGHPPRVGPGGNLPTITLSKSVGSPRAYIGGHLVLAPAGPMGGAPLTVPSPLADGGTVELEGISFTGGLFAAGRLTVAEESRVFGAVYAAGGFEGTERLEVWYDRRLGQGGWPGWPVVAILPGSWRLVAE